nr:MAG TPA: hypothetical protein [Caudoviricetes sp.]
MPKNAKKSLSYLAYTRLFKVSTYIYISKN